ncbi:DUF5691 domain-containing protein [Nocardia vermiculata]|uniref:SWIM zinc finger family protein n=1 Tax=Nocardia vermiculata TaxID=257274 RepID=A0A846XPZ5_9NOCA|nr:DUF5691 domain-containing protein [Nocardia vermiculata]NKY49123.1 SWIM zinc finger family protein [Nocardia vermiculata]
MARTPGALQAISTANVLALAPDAASARAARTLTSAWQRTGVHDGAVWGLCIDSGATAHRTVVDLSGPVYRCSCADRKFPCKHALSLLLLWSRGSVTEQAVPGEFVAQWPAPRTGPESRPTGTKSRGSKPSALEQRRPRVAAGLGELAIWLADQVRTGLAQADRSPAALEAMAARMVDAQAPGVAAALRQLPRRMHDCEHWHAVLLSEYARLHLLIDAHDRLEELPPESAAAVRTHIGYSVRADAVRDGEPAVPDEWLVLGVRITEEERVFTRRTLLRGRNTRRWAHILEHSFGGANFSGPLPAPGTSIEAELHFYPGAVPLRAVWGTHRRAPVPFTTIVAESATIAEQLTHHAGALSKDPWLRAWPVLLSEVVPVQNAPGWWLAESDGTAVPIAATADVPWQLIGLSGGHPLTVIGEWTAAGLIPISALSCGELIDVQTPSRTGVPTATTLPPESSDAVAPVALLGTARRGVDLGGLPAVVATAVRSGSREQTLLDAAALLELYQRGGVQPVRVEPGPPAVDDERPLLSPAAARRLRALLAAGSPLLTEWFDAARPLDRRAPDALCAMLLEQARTHATLREPLLQLAGPRGRWLAELQPRWRALHRGTDTDAAVWSHGRPAQRRTWLTALRGRDADAARAALSETWAREPARGRAELLATLATGIGPGDEALLETALDDVRGEVRRTAADLLAHLPDSAFAARMCERATAWVVLRTSGRAAALSAQLPDELDAGARRDGLDTPVTHPGGSGTRSERVRRLLAATPLRYWESRGCGPATIRALEMPADLVQGSYVGWSEAALAQQDPRWAETLFEILTATPQLGVDARLRQELFALLPSRRQVHHLCGLDNSWLAELELLTAALPRPWPLPVAEHLMRLLLERAHLAAARPGAAGLSPASHRILLQNAAITFPVTAIAAVTVATDRCADPSWQAAFARLADTLTRRTAILEELR